MNKIGLTGIKIHKSISRLQKNPLLPVKYSSGNKRY